jgi:class 3 adenylate cyclase/tetratricopeptide (TPR) repeat protein
MPAPDERKPVTVLFADVAGSTELATRHDAEALRALLSAFFEEMRQQIEAFGGTVEKFAGDAVMAVFGVPAVHEDDAERAVRAAVAMRDAVAQLNPMFEQEYAVRLTLRIGVASGEAVAASRPSSEFMVTGVVPNLAARLQAIADPIAVSEETYRQVAPLLEAEPTGPRMLKGFPEPVAAWRVLDLRGGESRPRGVPGLTSPVVGRDRELATLRACVDDLRRGRGQVVVITGEAGIGKSRVKIELRDGLSDDVRWLEGRCQSYTQNTSYTPIVQVLRAALGLGASEPAAIARTRLRVALRALAGERSDQVIAGLARLLDVELGAGAAAAPLDPQGLRSQVVLATRAVLEGLAERTPVVVAIEDLHWADAASVELLTLLAELTDLHPIMLVVTTRPETEGNAWSFRQHVERVYRHRLTDLRLASLAEDDSRRLADNLLHISDLPETIREAIQARAEGNPFFLEEILRALIEQGVLRRADGRWVVGAETPPWTIPSTLRGVLTARIDRLDGPVKAVLQYAAVVGRFFEYRTLAALVAEPGDLDRALTDLLRAELIREWARRPERQYVFKHALTQEAAYASILAEQRKALHAAVARYLEQAAGEVPAEQAAVLAHHWEGAHEWERALDYTLRAAARARALYARPEAVAHHWRAVDLLHRLPVTPARRVMLVETVERLVRLPAWFRTGAERERGLKLLEDAARIAPELGDPDLAVRVEAFAGYVFRDEKRLQRAVAQTSSPGVQALAADWYHLYLGQTGRYHDALVHARRAIELYGAAGARLEQALAINQGGRCWGARAGHLSESVEHALRFRAMAAEFDDARLRAYRGMEAEPYVYAGRWSDAVRVAEESLPLAFEIGEIGVATFVSSWLGLAYLKLDRPGEARRVTERALRFAETHPTMLAFPLTYLAITRALCDLTDGEPETAVQSARQACEMAVRGGFRLEEGAAHRALGQALEATGRRSEADAAYRRSREVFETIQSLPELAQTLLAYGHFLLRDDSEEGRRLAERARQIFEQIGASWWSSEAARLLRSAA